MGIATLVSYTLTDEPESPFSMEAVAAYIHHTPARIDTTSSPQAPPTSHLSPALKFAAPTMSFENAMVTVMMAVASVTTCLDTSTRDFMPSGAANFDVSLVRR